MDELRNGVELPESEEALLADFGVLVAAEYDYSLGG